MFFTPQLRAKYFIQVRKSVKEFQSLIVWGKKLDLQISFPANGFEMPGNDDSWYACLGEQGHPWVSSTVCCV